jgi:hypothetical protein
VIALAVPAARRRAKTRTTKTTPSKPAIPIATNAPAGNFAARADDSAKIFVADESLGDECTVGEPPPITINARCVVATGVGTLDSGAEVFTTPGATSTLAGKVSEVTLGRAAASTVLDLE